MIVKDDTRPLVTGPVAAPTVSFVICCYSDERWSLLVKAIRSCLAQDPPARDVVVVVDYNPNLLARIKELFPTVVAVPNAGQKGLSGARNTGIANATGCLVVFLDDDAVASPSFGARLAGPMSDPKVIGTGGMSVPAFEDTPPRWFPEEFYWTVGCTHRGVPRTAQVVRNPFGGAMAIRREAFERVGGFRSDLGRIDAIPLGCEETEWCIRAAQATPGGIFMHEPQAVMHHFVPLKRLTWSYFFSRCLAEGYSKAMVSRFVGAEDGLSSERSYVVRVLTRGVLEGIRDTLKGDVSGLGRAAAITSGLAVTTYGYVRGRLSRAIRERVDNAGKAPPIARRYAQEGSPAG
ncbi:glycosyltransferase [uncultured Alsobacter sp.]|uniref:glycosyltransferase family 2 protein n=1 Tax=uncultured Alsobacter sp. TaxID=1748258 RepID=UPI0025F2BACC|nr:glycosyltransferase [uncultured Alsobacter sp.]